MVKKNHNMPQKITLEVLNDNEEKRELYDYIENSANGTIFHHPEFLSYHGKNKFSDQDTITHLIFRKGNKILGFLPGLIHKTEKGLQFNSPYGASFGGLVVGEVSFEKCEYMIETAMQYLFKEKNITEINITPSTTIYMGQKRNDYLEYIYLSKGFKLINSELTIVTEIMQDKEFPDKIFKYRVKKFIKQSERGGVECRITDDIDAAYSIITENRKRFTKDVTHTLIELKTISSLFPGRLLQFVAYKDNVPIAVCCLILCNSRVTYSLYIDQLRSYAELRPVDFIVNQVLIWLKENNFLYLDFGPSTFGLEPHRSLIFFKEGFGGKGIIKHFYQYKTECFFKTNSNKRDSFEMKPWVERFG